MVLAYYSSGQISIFLWCFRADLEVVPVVLIVICFFVRISYNFSSIEIYKAKVFIAIGK